MRIEEVALPLGFGQIHTLDLLDWEGDATDAAFTTSCMKCDSVSDRHRASAAGRAPDSLGSKSRLLVIGTAVLVAVGGGFAAYRWQQSRMADRNFRAGLEQQFAREPNLESARNFFLDALALRAGHARSSYYLGHVYAQLGQPELAQLRSSVRWRNVRGLTPRRNPKRAPAAAAESSRRAHGIARAPTSAEAPASP